MKRLVLILHSDRVSGMAQDKVQFDRPVRIIKSPLLQQADGDDSQFRFFLAFADRTVKRRFPHEAFSSGEFGKTGERSIRSPGPDEISPVVFHHSNSDLLGMRLIGVRQKEILLLQRTAMVPD